MHTNHSSIPAQLDRARHRLRNAHLAASRVQRSTPANITGGLGSRIEGLLAAQRKVLVRAERDLEEIAAIQRRAVR